MELVSVLDYRRPSKTDKTTILSDAVRVLTQLQSESKRMKETIQDLQYQIKDLKVHVYSFAYIDGT